VPLLDECYVITHHAQTSQVVTAIKKGLEEIGMGDLVKEIRYGDGDKGKGPRPVSRRIKFAKREIYLPMVLSVTATQTRPLDYEQDVLYALDWQGLDVSPLVALIPDNATRAEHQMRRIRLAESGEKRIVDESIGASPETLVFDMAYAVRMISDIVPNAWWAREIVGQVIDGLKLSGFGDDKLGESSGLIVETLRAWLGKQRDTQAEKLFRAEVAAGRIQFRLRTDGWNWHMPFKSQTFEPVGAEQLLSENGEALGKSLFAPIYRGDFSSNDERDIAVYLDSEQTLDWWHRNVAKSHFALQGWRKEKIYPDFIFAVRQSDTAHKLVALEMKGQHLAGNEDTTYKQAVLQLMTEAYRTEQTPRVGELELVVEDGTSVKCDLVLMTEWRYKLPELIK